MANKKSSYTAGSWWAKKTYGVMYMSERNMEDWEDKRQNTILKDLEDKARKEHQRKKRRKHHNT